ncbi:MAG: right-handed parallel beta-helix repeat-containing protein [bacterium]|nr:right-handed parallel beta-helix repeat-containing protein [bacterium]
MDGRRLGGAVILALVIGAIPAAAADGRIPIYQAPVTITQPGSYYLTQDITHVGSGESITIAADQVTIDFNGHTLLKENAGNYAIASDGDYTDITIRNGKLIGGNIGIRLRNTVGDDFNVRIEKMIVKDALNEGIYVQGQSLVGSSQVFIENNSIHDTGNDGLSLRFMWGGRVTNNVIQDAGTDAGDHGIYMHSCRGVTVADNNVSHSGADGIRCWYSWYCSFERNHTTYNADWGIHFYQGDSHVFQGNRAYGNGAGGLTVPGGEGHINAGGNYPPP